jgi:glycosyltransferase involved in cell wall biosynthesis
MTVTGKLKGALVVHGRFHAFDLARSLLRQGNDIQLFTNYPRWAAAKFGLPKETVHNLVSHGVASRLCERLGIGLEAQLHMAFGGWAATQLQQQSWDFVHCFSGVAEELLNTRLNVKYGKLLVRGSAHIRTQHEILLAEEERAGRHVEKPSAWMIDREEREYQATDYILVLSTFARRSFERFGVDQRKLMLIHPGVKVDQFRATDKTIQERCQRIRSGEALRVVCVGTLSYQKGLLDLVAVIKALKNEKFRFQFVGTVPREEARVLRRSGVRLECIPRMPQSELHAWYAESDLFFFPTLHDGFAVVLAQAHAAGLPILATTNCAAPDIVTEGKHGWIVPIRCPEAFIERLVWCDRNRSELADMVEALGNRQRRFRDWDDTALDLVSAVKALPRNCHSVAP